MCRYVSTQNVKMMMITSRFFNNFIVDLPSQVLIICFFYSLYGQDMSGNNDDKNCY